MCPEIIFFFFLLLGWFLASWDSGFTVLFKFVKNFGYYFFKNSLAFLSGTPITHRVCCLLLFYSSLISFWYLFHLCISFWVAFIPMSSGSLTLQCLMPFLHLVDGIVFAISVSLFWDYFTCTITVLLVVLQSCWSYSIYWQYLFYCPSMLNLSWVSYWDLFLLICFLNHSQIWVIFFWFFLGLVIFISF